MRYLPKSPAERQEMLAAIGAKSIDELFSSIPERFRLRQALKIPGPYSETEVIQYFKDRAAENSNGYTSFLGAGVYKHYRPVLIDTVVSRGEFLTSYTPYQPEISQGRLEAILNFQQTLIDLSDRIDQMARSDPSPTVCQLAQFYLHSLKIPQNTAEMP